MAKARELAAWFRDMAGEDGSGLMARTAAALEREARGHKDAAPRQDLRPANDNRRGSLQRRKP